MYEINVNFCNFCSQNEVIITVLLATLLASVLGEVRKVENSLKPNLDIRINSPKPHRDVLHMLTNKNMISFCYFFTDTVSIVRNECTSTSIVNTFKGGDGTLIGKLKNKTSKV